MRAELYGTLAKAKLPAPTVQQLTYNAYLFSVVERNGVCALSTVDIGTNTGDARLFYILEIVLFADERPLL